MVKKEAKLGEGGQQEQKGNQLARRGTEYLGSTQTTDENVLKANIEISQKEDPEIEFQVGNVGLVRRVFKLKIVRRPGDQPKGGESSESST
jgi:hypothetical protein